MSYKNYKILLISAISALCLAGCGNTNDDENALASFSSSVSEFTDYIKEADDKINGIDVTQKDATSELLDILDDMDTQFTTFSEIDVPTQYQGVKSLAESASQNMSSAVSYYHSIYEADEFDSDDAEIAYKYYTRAVLEINCIGYLLEGESIPEEVLNDAGIKITVYEESNDENILNKWLSNNDEDEPVQETDTVQD